VVTEPLTFYQNVSPSKELRDASNEAEQLALDFGVESSMRIDVYNAKVAAQKNIEASGKKLNAEEQRLVEKMVQDGTRSGLALPEADRERLTVWKKELSQVCLEFSVSIFQSISLWMSTLLMGYRKTSTRRK
jgi:Zn-dependent oligopeptidase